MNSNAPRWDEHFLNHDVTLEDVELVVIPAADSHDTCVSSWLELEFWFESSSVWPFVCLPIFVRINMMQKRIGRGPKRRHPRPQRADRALAFHKAAVQLLSIRDADLVSVAQIAKTAGKSVGSFYHRFPDKEHFLRATIERTLRAAEDQAEKVLDVGARAAEPTSKVIRAAAEQMVGALHGLNAGVIRAAVKQSQLEPTAFEPILSHRAAVADRLVAALAARAKKSDDLEQRIRTAVQVAHGALIDVLLHKAGPLREGQPNLSARMTEVMQAIIGASDEDLPPKPAVGRRNARSREGVHKTAGKAGRFI